MRRIRFSLRQALLAIACLAIAVGLVSHWWTKPYAMTGSYANGVRAWEQWERRTLSLNIDHVATIRFYRTGQKAFVSSRGKREYWSPDGNSVSEREFHSFFDQERLGDAAHDQTKRPFQSFLWWWNGW
jgi:hypothetical protein